MLATIILLAFLTILYIAIKHDKKRDFAMQYNQRIRDLREDNNKSQKEIAELLETSQSYYSEYELGKRQLPIHHLKTLCLYYNVSADYILGLPKGLSWPR